MTKQNHYGNKKKHKQSKAKHCKNNRSQKQSNRIRKYNKMMTPYRCHHCRMKKKGNKYTKLEEEREEHRYKTQSEKLPTSRGCKPTQRPVSREILIYIRTGQNYKRTR